VQTIYALTKYNTKGASSRVRFSNLIPALRTYGWEISHFPLLSDPVLSRFYNKGRHSYSTISWHYVRRLIQLRHVAPPDLWWVEKEVLYGFPLALERVLLNITSQAVIDYDDAVFLNYRKAFSGRWSRYEKFAYYARSAAYLTVGSDYLQAEFARRGACRIKKIPSSINTQKYSLHEHRERDTITIGWIGTPVTVRFMDPLKDVLQKVARRIPIRVHVLGAKWKCPGVEVRCFEWTEESEAKAIQQFDIGVMPLTDGEWERGKCAYKLIQYMAAGVVPVGSRVGENSVVIEDGVNGFLASESGEWVHKLTLVASDHLLRARIGLRARRNAVDRFDCGLAARAVDGVFREALVSSTGSSQQYSKPCVE
jgi:glycosyltransferase involved in cell wall biosynthesis